MSSTLTSVTQIVSTLQSSHQPEIVAIVTAHHFATSLMDHFGRSNNVSLESSIHLIDRMAAEYAKMRGHSLRDMLDARWDIVSAGREADKILD